MSLAARIPIIHSVMTHSMAGTALSRLTKRELECLRLAARPMVAKEIAAELGISPKTVEGYLDSARQKLGASTRYAAIRLLKEHDEAPEKAPGAPDRVGGEPPARSPTPAIGEGQGASSALRLGEQQVPYRISASQLERIEVPFPTAGRPRNELTIRQRLLWLLVLTVAALTAVGTFLSGLLALSGAIRGR